MPSERKPGSNRGRAVIDWNEARLFYCGLPPQERTYDAVAAQFGVSARTVERHGTRERWREHARAVDQDAATIIARRIGKKRADEAERLMKLLEVLEDLDDVQNVYANFDIPDAVMQRLSA